jgi:hypothetical protein
MVALSLRRAVNDYSVTSVAFLLSQETIGLFIAADHDVTVQVNIIIWREGKKLIT